MCALLLWWITPINCISTKFHPFFAPERLGKNKKPFKMYKFRSMKIGSPFIPPYEIKGISAKLNLEIYLRITSLDKTPQFINVLFGQMSLVGPRPGARLYKNILIKTRESFAHNAYDERSGITDYPQIYMKRQHDVNSKVWFDSEYVKRHLLFLTSKYCCTLSFS